MVRASGGTATFSPTASMRPLRMTTVPLAMTGPLTVTILALRTATTGGASASTHPENRSKAAASRFIEVMEYYSARGSGDQGSGIRDQGSGIWGRGSGVRDRALTP